VVPPRAATLIDGASSCLAQPGFPYRFMAQEKQAETCDVIIHLDEVTRHSEALVS
jgi:hypothetical protein